MPDLRQRVEAALTRLGSGQRYLFVHNPDSRLGRATAARVRRSLERRGLDRQAAWVGVEALSALEPGSAPTERAVALGGDGTVNAVAHWLLETGLAAPAGTAPAGTATSGAASGDTAPTALAIIPAGTGNNLARGLGIPRDRSAAMELALHGAGLKRIDAIRYRPLDGIGEAPSGKDGGGAGGTEAAARLPTWRIIIQGAAWGLPAEIAERFASLRRHRVLGGLIHLLGDLAYRLLALEGVARRRAREWRHPASEGLLVRAQLPNEVIEGEALAVFAGNEPTLGGGFRPCPRAALDDGRLDLCLVRARTPHSYLRLLSRVARGSHLDLTGTVEYRQTPGPVDLRFERPAPLLADGDIWMAARSYRLELLPGALLVVVAA